MSAAAAIGAGPLVELEDWLRGDLAREHQLALGDCAATSLRELGLDSLELAALAGRLERRLGRSLPSGLIYAERSIRAALCGALGRELGAASEAAGEAAGTCAHPYRRCVNPELARRLEALSLDRRFVRGEGSWLYDEQGRAYLDFLSAYGALPFGHNPPEIWDAALALRRSAEPCFAMPSYLDAAGELAERLLRIAPSGLQYVAFTNSGAESIEVAIKLCRAATGRSGVLSFERSFHGKTLAALSATGNAEYQDGFGAPAPGFERIALGDLAQLRRAIQQRPQGFAALLLEPIQGEGGVIVPPPGFLAEAAALCREAGILVVADEVQTGLGRTGEWFACRSEGVQPDVLALAKALGGGLVPVGAVLYSARASSQRFSLKHSSTFAGNALACRVALAALERIERDGEALLEHVRRCGERLRAGLLELQARYPALLREVRGRGFLLGLELGLDDARADSNLLCVAAQQGWLGMLVSGYLLAAEGVRVAPALGGGNVVRVAPPLNASEQECEIFLERLERALRPFSELDSGRVLRVLLAGEARSGSPAVAIVPPAAQRRAARPPGGRRFAFLLHALEATDLRRFDPSLTPLSHGELERATRRLSGLVEPFAVSEVEIEAPSGARTAGEFILIPETADSLLELPRAEAIARVRRGIELAAQRGAQFVGLGGYTSIVTRGGLEVADVGLPLTTGNAFTAVAGLAVIELALARLGRSLEGSCAAVLGAGGSVGSALALLLAARCERLILLGNPARPQHRSAALLRAVAGEICRELAAAHRRGERFAPGSLGAELVRLGLPPAQAPLAAFEDAALRLAEQRAAFVISSNAELLVPLADVVAVATSSTRTALAPRSVKRGALVCDFSRPRNLRPADWERRPDVLVIDGGVVEVPGRPLLGPFGLPHGYAFSCMAETMLWSLQGRSQHCSLGPRLQPGELAEVAELARRHGFAVRSPTRFDRALDWGALPPRARLQFGAPVLA